MPVYKHTIDFLPKPSTEEVEERFKVSKAGVYAAILPLLAALIWLAAVFINFYYRNEVKQVEAEILAKRVEVDSYLETRRKQTELVLKVDSLTDLVQKDFFPQKFFDDVSDTIKSTGDAQATIYAYGREEDGMFSIEGRANSYLDLAKIMVVFTGKREFENVIIKSIHYNPERNNVNFEIKFYYSGLLEEV
ncbi:hypothetical protein JW766_02875 [Candidatus Dojkabacteria bacterium]|nr:hypothetical protein [Candidatus Dojkabacteria bacterium]